MTADQIKALTQSILAVLVVVGSGILLAVSDVEAALLVGIVGVVLGYFFGSSVPPQPFYSRRE